MARACGEPDRRAEAGTRLTAVTRVTSPADPLMLGYLAPVVVRARLPVVGLVIAVLALGGGTVCAEQEPILVGESASLDASATQAHPWRLEWFVYEAGTSRPAEPDHVTESQDPVDQPPGRTWLRAFPDAGSYTVDLVAHYLHESPDPEHVDGYGHYAIEAPSGTIEVKSVRASFEIQDELGNPTTAFTTDETIVLGGSVAPVGTAPDVAWTLDGQPFSPCDGVLVCSVAPGVIGPGPHQISLSLTDPDGPTGYSTDTAGPAPFEVYPPLSVDFTWIPANPDPGQQVTFTLQSSIPTDQVDSVQWSWGDGSSPETIDCNLWPCTQAIHSFPSESWYTVEVAVTTSTESDSETHDIEVGDPVQPPSAMFGLTPADPSLLEQTTLALDTPCTGTCTYAWDFGDGTGASASSPGHAWAVPDTYTVSVTVANEAGSDQASLQVPVTSCWAPPAPEQVGICFGAPVQLVAADGAAFQWCPNAGGATTRQVTVSQPVPYWVDVESGSGCWGHSPITPTLVSCGDPGGNANLDAHGVDAADLAALLTELEDGDGTAVPQSGGGDLHAPGGDCTDGSGGAPDGQLTGDDLIRIIEILYSSD